MVMETTTPLLAPSAAQAMTTALLAGALLAGALLWTLTEYLLHRFAGHRRGGTSPLTREHLAHHADPDYFTPWPRKVALALPVSAALALALWPLMAEAGAALLAGFVCAWLGYEWLHRRIHTHAPLGRYGAWARRHHLAHHFCDPGRNHGVTTALWDRLFGTHGVHDVVRIPARRLPRWLASRDGAVDTRYAGSYQVSGRRRPAA
jgi:sterol desaturase/sphingolipid hydroxylase (fatty acid hydroxylase superfamily)